MKRRPGFVSATGIVSAVVVLLGAGAMTHLVGPGLFSPGQLSAQTSAEPLGGVTNHAGLGDDCGACHPAPWSSRTMADACLDCHTEVGKGIQAADGLHGRLEGMQTSPTCTGCHPEHGGPDGPLTALDEASFRSAHDLTGFSLASHRETQSGDGFACADCHPKDWAPFDQAVCTDCHAGIDATFMKGHEATYGEDCLPCHDGTGRIGADFDHSTTGYALTGKHGDVACKDCHEGAQSARDLRDTPQKCYACHAEDDEHDGAYGRQCGDCHSAASWDEVTFDHEVFPLDHGDDERKATCETCHPAGTATYTCYGCHAHTEGNVLRKHEGRSLAALEDCIRCHRGGRTEGD